MENNSSFINKTDPLSEIRLSICGKMKMFAKMIIKAEFKNLIQISPFLVSLFHKSAETILKLLRDCNNKLNIYTEIKREYNFQNKMEDKLIYIMGRSDGHGKSMINIMIIAEKKDNQQIYFNC